jgi:TolB-like protein
MPAQGVGQPEAVRRGDAARHVRRDAEDQPRHDHRTPPAQRRQVRTAVAGLAAVVLAALLAFVSFSARRTAVPAQPVLAVLPFENLGPAADVYFADGLTEEVRGHLAGIAGLRVIGGRSAQRYRGSTKSAREIARELGATHLLTGTVRWERAADGGGRVRVSPELVRAADQASVWSEPVEGPLSGVFAMQARVADRVAGALDVALRSPGPRASAPPRTHNPAAYGAYLRGLAHAASPNRFSATARQAAMEAFERAVALDSQFAAAHARLAVSYLTERDFGRDGGLREKSRASLARAMALDSTLLESHLARAAYLTVTDDPEGAYDALQAAARMAPGDAEIV